MRYIHSQHEGPSLHSRIGLTRSTTTPVPSPGHSHAFSTRTSSPRGSSTSRACEPYVESSESLPLFRIDPISSVQFETLGHAVEDGDLLGPTTACRARTLSPKSSYESSTRASTTIYIRPSLALQAMQSVGIDTGHETFNGFWRRSDRYVTHSQTSLLPEVYKPSGLPQHLHDELNTATRTSWSRCASRTASLEAFWQDEFEDAVEPKPRTEPAPVGPSNQDIEDLIERQDKWGEEQRHKAWSPLQRFASISKEFTGGLVRTLSKGPGKKGFEARTTQMRTASQSSDLRGPQSPKKPNFLRRYHTVGGTQGHTRLNDRKL
jgi:hypothetical protein